MITAFLKMSRKYEKGFRYCQETIPVGETSRSRCNTLHLIKVLQTLIGCGTFFYRHSGPTDLKELFDEPNVEGVHKLLNGAVTGPALR